MSNRAPMEEVLENAPELHAWWKETQGLGSSLHSQSIDLAYELLDQPEDEMLHLLRKISPGIEMLLNQHDDNDEISLGFLEVLVAESAELNLNRGAIREALGPSARQQWDSLDTYRGNGPRGPAA